MSTLLARSDNSFLADAGPSPLDRDGPPPNYDESHLSTSVENHRSKTDPASVSELMEFSLKLIEIFNSVIKIPDGVMYLMEEFKVVLRQQPPANQVRILDIIHTLSGIYNEMLGSSGGLLGSSKKSDCESTEAVKNDEQMGENTTPAGSSYVQHDQYTTLENLPTNTKKPNPVIDSKNRDENASLNSQMPRRDYVNTDVIILGTPASSSELSSPSTISTPSETRTTHDLIEETELLDCEHGVLEILDQSIEDFVQETCEQIRLFTSLEDLITYKVLYGSLKGMYIEKEAKWSNGTEWASFVMKGCGSRQIGSIKYAMTAMAFEKWHTSQVALLSDMSSMTASQLVTRRLIGNKPVGNDGQNNWGRQRKRINTHLSRGRKWCRLVQHLGFGILFKNPWDLVKTKDSTLTDLIEKLKNQKKKMRILKSLTKQFEYLVNSGKTNESEFNEEMRIMGYLDADTRHLSNATLLDEFYKEVKQFISSDAPPQSLLRVSNHTFEIDSLQRLKPHTWLNDDIIIACLHLSDKLSFIRIGFSVPMHLSVRPYSPMGRPFEMVANQVEKWRKESDKSLVCFFPLYQHNNHFTLLEINDREGFIFHYDSLMGNNDDVKKACENEIEPTFSKLKFSEQEAMEQDDTHSCGLMVIKHAQCRMLGLPATYHRGAFTDPEELRREAISMLKNAWDNGALVKAPIPHRKKRRL